METIGVQALIVMGDLYPVGNVVRPGQKFTRMDGSFGYQPIWAHFAILIYDLTRYVEVEDPCWQIWKALIT